MVGSFLQMDSYMKREYEQRKVHAVVKAEGGGLELRSPASSACGRKHICTLFTQGRECGAREFVEEFYPLLWLILYIFI